MIAMRDEQRELRATISWLELELEGAEDLLRQRDLQIAEQQEYIGKLEQQVEELKTQATPETTLPSPTLPPFIKPDTQARRRKTPGRAVGHVAALRPMPKKIDRRQDVPLPKDLKNKPVCPHCRTRLTRLRQHKRIVEDLLRSSVETTCYQTQSGHCARCQCRIESRDSKQPPAANLPHGQLGVNALATAAILRVRHRLPFRQIVQLLRDLPGMQISPGGLVKQIRRLARWLDGKYQDLLLRMRASPHVHVDETGWRIDGQNFWLWAFTDPTFTLYHVDESRGGKVPLKLLGKAFNGTVVADFYSAYNALDSPKQRCLVHLLREVKEIGEEDAEFKATPFARRLRLWCQAALDHKKLWNDLHQREYDRISARLERRLDQLLKLDLTHKDARRLATRVSRHRQELTRFLYYEHLEGTNNPAERALRPAVVMRKITGGNRSRAGADAWAKLASLLRTADQQQLGVYDAMLKLITEYWEQQQKRR